jgi:hypothetical protein
MEQYPGKTQKRPMTGCVFWGFQGFLFRYDRWMNKYITNWSDEMRWCLRQIYIRCITTRDCMHGEKALGGNDEIFSLHPIENWNEDSSRLNQHPHEWVASWTEWYESTIFTSSAVKKNIFDCWCMYIQTLIMHKKLCKLRIRVHSKLYRYSDYSQRYQSLSCRWFTPGSVGTVQWEGEH